MTRFCLCVLTLTLAAASAPTDLDTAGRLRFEPLSHDRFVVSGLHYEFLFDAKGITYRNGKVVRRLRFDGVSPLAVVEPLDQQTSVSNRFIGNDRSKWKTPVPNYDRLRVSAIYPGIDLVYYGTAGSLEYDMNVKPGGDPSRIHIRITGDSPRIDPEGNLAGDLLQKHPVAYQIASNGMRSTVECRYRKHSDGTFGFAVGRYDHSRELVIDPVLTMSTYVGGTSAEYARAIGHDREGFLYVAGVTGSTDLPLAGDPEQTTSGGSSDVFVSKIDPHGAPGSEYVYTTYFGGSGIETLNDMVVSPAGTVYITGSTTSTNLPTVNPAQAALSGTKDAFVAVIDPKGGASGLLYSSYVGGTNDDIANGITLGPNGRFFIAGITRSTDFPIIGGAQSASAGGADAFVAGFDLKQSGSGSLVYSTYFGGTGTDEARSIAADASGNLWITGSTYSYDFPLVGNSYQNGNHTGGDAFLAQLSTSAGFLYSTYIGGAGIDVATKITFDVSGRLFVTGYTTSTDFPATPDAFRIPLAGSTDAFIMIWTPVDSSAPQLKYSTLYGGNGGEVPYDVKGDPDGNIYVVGYTTSGDLPIVGNALEPSPQGGVDGFALKFNPSRSGGAAIDYSSYITSQGSQIAYAVDVDSVGNVYVAGGTTGSMLQSSGTGQRSTSTGVQDAFVSGFSPCTVQLSLASYQFATSGGNGTITMNLSQDCRWVASNVPDWVTLSPTSGTSGGDIQITASPNTTGADRQANFTIGNVRFLVGQNQ
jgi:hypothetical protein